MALISLSSKAVRLFTPAGWPGNLTGGQGREQDTGAEGVFTYPEVPDQCSPDGS